MNANRNKNLIFLLLISCFLAIASCSTDEQSEMIEISLDKSTLTLVLGDTETLTVTPSSNQIEWISSNTDVITVTNGVITAVGLGDAIVNAKIGNSRAFCEISVIETPVDVKGVNITDKEVVMTVGKTKKLEAVVEPDSATYKNVRWSSNRPEIVFVDDLTGDITAKSLGEAVITVTTVDGGKEATCIIKVWPELNLHHPHNEASLTLDPTDSESSTKFIWSPIDNINTYIFKLSLFEDFPTTIFEEEINRSSIELSSYEFNELIKDVSTETINLYWTVEPKDSIHVVGEIRAISVNADDNEYLRLVPSTADNLTVSKGAGEYQYTVEAGAGTSSVSTVPLTRPLDPKSVMASIMTRNSNDQFPFEIILVKADKTVMGSVASSEINSSKAWEESAINVDSLISDSFWGEIGDYLKLRFSNDNNLEINGIHFRPMNYQEIKDNYVPQVFELVSYSPHTILEEISEYHYRLESTGPDPNSTTSTLFKSLPEGANTLSFEYKSTQQMRDNLQLFLGSPDHGLAESRSLKLGVVPASPDWATYTADLTSGITGWGWGVSGSYIRIDIGEKPDYEMEIKNIKIIYED